MRSGWNPTRRNRNIGTSKQGHGENNRFVVPRSWADSVYEWKRVPEHVVVRRKVWGVDLPIVVEPTRRGSLHACTVDDIARMLNLLPCDHIDPPNEIPGIQGVVLRQPTRKEEALRPVWGRVGFAVDVGPLCGPVIFLEAQPVPLLLKWTGRLRVDGQQELARLTDMADQNRFDGRHHHLTFSLAGIRRVQLYHTLPHEVGHWVDMYKTVELPSLHEDYAYWEKCWDRYWQRVTEERESYAHRYATEAVQGLRECGQIPFPRQIDLGSLQAENLRPEDFVRR
jgi:hypothetical protein